MHIAETIHFLIWGPWTLALFLGVGIWFSIKSGFFQFRGLACWWGCTAGSLWKGREGAKGKGITQFQSACTALAATIGTGNIVGVATALTAGGPGALFWMWVSAAIGMMTAYGETSLGQRFRYRGEDGHWMCGPMVYMDRGLGCRRLGALYAWFAVLASFGMGSMVQSNSISETLHFSVGLPPAGSALLVTVLTGAVISGGIGRISRVSEKMVPLSAGIYIVFSLMVILSYWERLPAVISAVFRDAFRIQSVGGGVSGWLLSRSVRYGLSRGVFSNEAGLGSLAVLHGAAEDTSPEQQGMWAMFEVFVDTIVVCTLTALVILCVGFDGGGRGLLLSGENGAALTAACFHARLGGLGEALVSGSMAVFAFATVIAWYYLGRQTFHYLARRLRRGRLTGKGGDRVYTALYLFAVFAGCLCRLETVWMMSDMWNGMMAYPNLAALLFLSGQGKYPQIKTIDKKGGNGYNKPDKRE